MGKQRAPKGSVSVNNFKGWLRLVWSHGGKREFLYLGLQDNDANRLLAQAKATQIEGDIKTGNYDKTLRKYKPEYLKEADSGVVDLIKAFKSYKEDFVDPRTLEKYDALINHCTGFFKQQKVSSIGFDKANRFKLHLEKSLASRTIKGHITTLNSCWEWAIKNDLIKKENPWEDIRDSVKIIPTQKPFPLSKEEVRKILSFFEGDEILFFYADFVRWLFSTGTRTGEAVALNWDHLSDDCSQAWIGESYSRRKEIKSAKMYKSRTIPLNSEIQEMLLKRKKRALNSKVFPAPKGGYLDAHNFTKRTWGKVLSELNIKHRKFYMTRSTFISHALMSGMHPVEVAAYVGDDIDTIYKYYASYIPGKATAPTLF